MRDEFQHYEYYSYHLHASVSNCWLSGFNLKTGGMRSKGSYLNSLQSTKGIKDSLVCSEQILVSPENNIHYENKRVA